VSFRLRLPLLAAALLALAPGAASAGDPAPAPAAAAPEIKREIRVRIACDEEWRSQASWEGKARDYLARASGVFERRFGIRWSAVDVVPWTSDDDADTLWSLLHQIRGEVSRDGADLVFGFTGQTHAKGSTTPYPHAGQACHFGPAAIVGCWRPHSKMPWRRGAVVHELAHVLGAWHTTTLGTIMSFTGRPNTADESDPEFDPQSVAVIELCRDLDFSLGVAWLDDARRRRIDEIFLAGHASDAWLPYVNAELNADGESDARVVRVAYGRALADMEARVGPKDPLLGAYLQKLARAWMDRPAPDFEVAEGFARRACDLAASGRDSEARLACDELLADVVWRQGRKTESVERYRRVYAARLAAAGPEDPHVVELKSWLDRHGGAMTPVLTLGPGATFESPPRGTIHLRPAPSAPSSVERLDEDVRSFEVAVASPGRLTIEFVQSGGPAPLATFRATAQIPAGFDPANPTVVGLSYRSIDDVASGWGVQYACRLFVRSPSQSDARFCGADAPGGAFAGVADALDFSGRGFVRLGEGAALVFSRQWSAARTWRLELTFVPDEEKK
jgi:hypothetical protein